MDIELLKEMVRSVNNEDCPISYEVIFQALKSLDDAGMDEFERFKIGYVKQTLTEKEHDFMEWLLRNDKQCLDDVLSNAELFSVLNIAEGVISDLVEKAKAYEKEGNLEEAVKCLKEALELRPDDQVLREKVIELTKRVKPKEDILEIIFGNIPQVLEWIKNKSEVIISEACKVGFKKGDMFLVSRVFERKDFLAVHVTSTKYKEKPPTERPKELIFEGEGYKIELEKGPTRGKFIITKM